MSYKALYRKYRPQNFSDIVGQDHIVKTLQNIIQGEKIGHAYLFAGPRGTGKTSVAHVFAREVNKTAAGDLPTSELDIIEIDAASNNGVAEVRTIIENSKYAPSSSKYKVYIIDEVHMLTKGAFNALLKTLEEPPAHVIFILATTEPHKIPITILSRTQRFNFRRIDDQIIRKQLKDILTKENITFENDAIRFISKLAQGGMRDALSIADQSAAFGNNTITFVGISQVFGIISVTSQVQLLNLSFRGEAKNLLIQVSSFLDNGADIERLTTSLIDVVKDFIFFKKTSDMSLLDTLTKDDLEHVEFTVSYAYDALDILIKLLSDLRFSQVPKQSFELALLQLTQHEHAFIKEVPLAKAKEIEVQEKVVTTQGHDIFITNEVSVKEKNIIDTDELSLTSEMITSQQESEQELNDLDEDILSTQEIPLNEINEVEESTDEIDLMSMFSTGDTGELELSGIKEEQEAAPLVDDILNLLVQANKDMIIQSKNILQSISRYAVDSKSSSYVSMLEKVKIVSAGEGFMLVASEDKTVISQLNKDRKTQSFVDFLAKAFKQPVLTFAITKEQFHEVKNSWAELSKKGELPQPRQIERVEATQEEESAEESFGKELFGDLFNK